MINYTKFIGPACWKGADLIKTDDWIWTLTKGEIEELRNVVSETLDQHC